MRILPTQLYTVVSVLGIGWLVIAWPVFLLLPATKWWFVASGAWLFDLILACLFAAELMKNGH